MPSIDATTASLVGAVLGGIGVAIVQAIAGRPNVMTAADVALSTEARQWASSFAEQMKTQRDAYEKIIAELRAENADLEAKLDHAMGRNGKT